MMTRDHDSHQFMFAKEAITNLRATGCWAGIEPGYADLPLLVYQGYFSGGSNDPLEDDKRKKGSSLVCLSSIVESITDEA